MTFFISNLVPFRLSRDKLENLTTKKPIKNLSQNNSPIILQFFYALHINHGMPSYVQSSEDLLYMGCPGDTKITM